MTVAEDIVLETDTDPLSTIANHESTKITSFRMPMLDGVRALACALVVIGHFSVNPDCYSSQTFIPEFFGFGNYGVVLFFCLSSFLLSYLFTKEYDSHGFNNIFQFFLRRTLRIWPLYLIFVVILNLCALLGLFSAEVGEFLSRLNPLLFSYLANWIYAQNHFEVPGGVPYIAVLWSLSVEEQIYLAFPFFASLLLRSTKRKKFYACGIIVLSLISRLVYMFFVNSGASMYYSTFSYADVYLIAGIFGALQARDKFSSLRGSIMDKWWVFLFLFIWLLSVMNIFATHLVAPFDLITVISYPLLGLTSCLCIVWLLNTKQSIVAAFLSLPAVRTYGVLSYSVYVWHVAVLYFLHRYLGDMFVNSDAYVNVVYFVLFFSLSLAVACASYGLIERPFLRIKERYSVSGSANFFNWQGYFAANFSVATVCFGALKVMPMAIDKLGYVEAGAVGLCALLAATVIGQAVRRTRLPPRAQRPM
jgi:peptidoglycan/LPS O-acetylase OafA/YrhL